MGVPATPQRRRRCVPRAHHGAHAREPRRAPSPLLFRPPCTPSRALVRFTAQQRLQEARRAACKGCHKGDSARGSRAHRAWRRAIARLGGCHCVTRRSPFLSYLQRPHATSQVLVFLNTAQLLGRGRAAVARARLPACRRGAPSCPCLSSFAFMRRAGA